MTKYELMYIIDVAMDEGPRHELIERVNKLITGNGGDVEKVDEWGKRRLAYPINYKNEGYYVLVNFSAASELPREIERVLQISEDVLRYLIVRLEQKHTNVKPRAIPVRPPFGRPPVDSMQPVDSVPAAPAAQVAPAPQAESTAPAPQAESAAPAPEAESAAPAPQAESAAPAPQAESTAPAPEAESAAPAPQAESTAPAEAPEA